jgi:hypothetical protein
VGVADAGAAHQLIAGAGIAGLGRVHKEITAARVHASTGQEGSRLSEIGRRATGPGTALMGRLG